MKFLTSLETNAVLFGALWTGWMWWERAPLAPAEVVWLCLCGALCGYGWYRLMRWHINWKISRRSRSGSQP